MRTFKNIITYIVAFVLTISLIICILISLLSSTILSERYVLSKLEETDYYSQIYKLVESNFENYIQQSGLDEDVIKNIVTEEKVKEDTQQILINLYDGLNESISTQDIEDSLNKNIEESLAGRDLSQEEQESIDTFVETLCNEYKNTILHTDYEEQINDMYQKILKYEKIAKRATIILLGVLVILLIIINIKRIYMTINAVAVAMLSSGIILTMINIYINSKIKIRSIVILNDTFSVLVRNILEDILGRILNIGLPLAIFGLLLIIISNLVHNVRKYGIKE